MLDKLFEILDYLWRYIFDQLTNVIFTVLNAIPVPDFLSNVQAYAGNLGTAAYWFGVFNVGTGITMILSAYAFRFLIRRIPIIG